MAGDSDPVDVLIITALIEERDAVLTYLPSARADGVHAAVAPATVGGQAGTVAVLPLLGMTPMAALTRTEEAVSRYQPRCVVLVGIAGGLVDGKSLEFGDLLIPGYLIPLDHIKVTETRARRWLPRFLRRPQYTFREPDFRLPVDIWQQAGRWAANDDLRAEKWYRSITVPRPDARRPYPLVVAERCAVGSGSVLNATDTSPYYQRLEERGALGLEMEAFGAAQAALSIPFLMVKGVCDDATYRKNDRWHTYAAHSAAAFAVAFLRDVELAPRPRGVLPTHPAARVADAFREVELGGPKFTYRFSQAETYDDLRAGTATESLSADELAPSADRPHVVLHGGGGAGKSRTARRLFVQLIEGGANAVFLDVQSSEVARAVAAGETDPLSFITEATSPAHTRDELEELASTRGSLCLVIDGIDRLPRAERAALLSWVLDQNRHPRRCVTFITDRFGSDEWDPAYMHMGLGGVDPAEARLHYESVHGPTSFNRLSVRAREVLERPFFLDLSLRVSRDEMEAAEVAHGLPTDLLRSFLRNEQLGDETISELAAAAYDQRKSFADLEVEAGLRDRLVGALVLDWEGRRFKHDLWSDYLIAEHLRRSPEVWGQESFDGASVYANAVEPLVFTVELLSSRDDGDQFLKAVYDWNWAAASDCIAALERLRPESLSPEIQIAIVVAIAEKQWDDAPRTRDRARGSLRLHRLDGDLAAIGRVDTEDRLRVEVGRLTSTADWFRIWQSLAVARQGGAAPTNLPDLVADDDSLIGWTASNAARRYNLDPGVEAKLREAYMTSASATVRWRIVHALGRHGNIENARVIDRAVRSDTYHWVKYYGAPRAAMEMAAHTDDPEIRRSLIEAVRACLSDSDAIEQSKQVQLRRELVGMMVIEGATAGWEEAVISLFGDVLRRSPGNEAITYRDAMETVLMRAGAGT